MARWNSKVNGLVEASKTQGYDPTEIIGEWDVIGPASHFSKLPRVPGGVSSPDGETRDVTEDPRPSHRTNGASWGGDPGSR
jgi:hypothetical protein